MRQAMEEKEGCERACHAERVESTEMKVLRVSPGALSPDPYALTPSPYPPAPSTARSMRRSGISHMSATSTYRAWAIRVSTKAPPTASA